MSVREINAALEGDQAKAIERLVTACDSPLPWRRKAAQDTLRHRGEAAIVPLLRLFEHETRLREAHLRFIGPMMVFGLIASSALLILNRISFRNDWITALASAALVVLIGGIFTGVANGHGRRHKRLARLLADCNSVAAVGPLADALEFDEDGIVLFPETQKAAQRGLARLLPRLRPEDRPLLNDHHWTNIIKTLQAGDTEFALSVLKAWEQVGDGRALLHVRRMAHGMALTESAKRVREAAQYCLKILEARIAEETAPKTLLRPSCANDWTPETLLRPVVGSGSTMHVKELLRGVSEDASDRKSTLHVSTGG